MDKDGCNEISKKSVNFKDNTFRIAKVVGAVR